VSDPRQRLLARLKEFRVELEGTAVLMCLRVVHHALGRVHPCLQIIEPRPEKLTRRYVIDNERDPDEAVTNMGARHADPRIGLFEIRAWLVFGLARAACCFAD
jgi:hypothetical protein